MRADPNAARDFALGVAALLVPALWAAGVYQVYLDKGAAPILARAVAASWFLAQALVLAAPFGRPGAVSLRAGRAFVYEAGAAAAMLPALAALDAFDLGWWFTLAPAVCGLALASLRGYFLPEAEHLRGRRLLSAAEAGRAASRARPPGDPGLPWGGVRAPSLAATTHFVAVGASGSGKTLTIRVLAGAMMRGVRPGAGRRAVVYDAKRDAVSIVHGMRPGCPVKILDPFDRRATRWAIAKDATTPAVCLQIAETLVRVEPGPNQFFSLAGTEVLAGVLVSLHLERPGRWDLRDVILAIRDSEGLKALLARRPETAGPLVHFAEPRTLANILSTVRVRMAQLEPIAAAWAKAEDEVSLAEWAAGEMVLVLGNDETSRVCLDALNRAILRRSVELVLSGPEVEGWRTLYVLDEVAQMGRLDCLSPLLTKGRSKGASVVLGFQDMDGLRAVYDKAADEIVGQCATKALLRVESPATAEWASRALGGAERVERQVTVSKAGDSTTHQRVRRDAALPGEFLSLPAATRAAGVTGYFVVPEVGAFRATLLPAYLRKHLHPKAAGVPDFLPRPAEDQYLRPDHETLAPTSAQPAPAADRTRTAPAPAGSPPAAEKRLRVVRPAEPVVE